MVQKQERFCDWYSSLIIFIFYELFLNKKTTIELDTYSNFKLTDYTVAQFNSWIEQGCMNNDIIENWLKNNTEMVKYFKNNFYSLYTPKVVNWSDRKKNSYFLEQLQHAHEFECYIEHFFRDNFGIDLGFYDTPYGQYELGECKMGIEIKFDKMAKKTGNLYFEYAEKADSRKEKYVRSGILKDDASKFFLIGDRDNFWIFRKPKLVEIYNEEYMLSKQQKSSLRQIQFKQISTSLGFIYPIRNAIQDAISIDELIIEIKQ